MRFSDIQGTLKSLDRSYEAIGAEHQGTPGSGALPAWESIVRGRPQREPGTVTGDLQCAQHGGAPHGLAHDELSDHLASELSEWVRVAEHSPTARSLLGIERIEAGAGARLGAMTYLDGDGELRVKLAASGDSVVPTEAGRSLWAEKPREMVSFRERSAHDEPHLLFSNEENKARRWSFSDVRKGYEEHQRAAGRRVDEAAAEQLSSSPVPKLLGALSDNNVRSPTEQVPVSISEAWLRDGTGADEAAGELAPPCEACKFALSAWMCGHPEMLRRATAGRDLDLATMAHDSAEELRGREEPPRSAEVAAVKEQATPQVIGATAALGGAAVAGAAATGTVAQGALALGGARGAVPIEMLDLPDRDVTGADRRPRRPSGEDRAPRVPFGSQGRRDRVRVRLESSDFSCEDVEIRELAGKEAISQLFSFRVDIVCFDENGLDTALMLGAGVSLVFQQGDTEVRRVHGMVAEVVDRLETESEWRSYRLWIVPRVWRSSLVETQEIYLDTNVPDLITQKLALVGLSGADVEMRLMGKYPVRELVAQYKETDVAFFSRLAEHLGICFFFEHDGGADKIVFSDQNSGFRPLQDAEALPFRARGDKVDVFEVESRSRAFPASFAMQDYNYRTPLVDLTNVFEAQGGFGGGVVEYGAHYKTPAEGASLAKIRAEERQVANQDYTCKSDIAHVTAGGTFQLTGHPRLDGAALLVTEVEHFVRQTVKMQGAGGDDQPYRNTFRAISSELPYRPPRATPRPRIHGVLTALVEPTPGGEIGEAAQIDAEGRYTVKFYFDAGDVSGRQKNSRPVRMIQGHSGPNYGIHFPLKPGIEVLIVFVDGDPDRPMILGSAPNPVTPSPVVQEVNLMNRIETASGLIIEMRDAVPPLAR